MNHTFKPCPFCGSTTHSEADGEVAEIMHHCSYVGPILVKGFTLQEAMANWNQRAEGEPEAWRELCRRLYVELFHCNQQMTGSRRKWTTGQAVADVLRDAKAALETQPARPLSEQVANVLDELEGALAKFPTWPTDPLHALAVLGEEFGELTKDVLQMVYEPHKTSKGNIRKEALQTAAMALRFLASLDRYEYAQGPQHEQGKA